MVVGVAWMKGMLARSLEGVALVLSFTFLRWRMRELKYCTPTLTLCDPVHMSNQYGTDNLHPF